MYILEGTLTMRMGADTYEMAGDYVCFPAGQKAGHCLINNSGATCRYVIVGERNPNEVAVYTDAKKVLVRVGAARDSRLTATHGYWHRENTGLPKGEIPPSDAVAITPEVPVKPNPPISSHDVAWEDIRKARGLAVARSISHSRPPEGIIVSAC